MATKTLDYESIINDATEKLEKRFAEIQEELVPLRTEEREVAEAIHRIVGSYPAGYSARPTAASRQQRTSQRSAPGTPAEDREAAVLSFVQSQDGGTTAKAIADALGITTNTLKTVLDPMLETGALRSEGERRGRKIMMPAAPKAA